MVQMGCMGKVDRVGGMRQQDLEHEQARCRGTGECIRGVNVRTLGMGRSLLRAGGGHDEERRARVEGEPEAAEDLAHAVLDERGLGVCGALEGGREREDVHLVRRAVLLCGGNGVGRVRVRRGGRRPRGAHGVGEARVDVPRVVGPDEGSEVLWSVCRLGGGRGGPRGVFARVGHLDHAHSGWGVGAEVGLEREGELLAGGMYICSAAGRTSSSGADARVCHGC